VDFGQIKKDIAEGKFKPVYLFHGEESFFIDLLEEQISDTVVPEAQRAFDMTVFYGKDSKVEQIKEALVRYPVLSKYHLVIIKEAQMLDKIDDLTTYAAKPVDTTIWVIVYKTKKLDGRKALYKAIQENGVVFESKPLYDSQIPTWIVQEVKEKGLAVNSEVANIIAEHVGNDLAKIVNEIEKLALNLSPGTVITEDHVQTYIGISKEYNFFELQKALGARDVARALHIGLYFAQNEKSYPMVQLISMLYSFFQKVYKMHALSGKSDTEIMKALGLPGPFFVKEYKLAASKYNRAKIETILEELRLSDQKTKGFGAISLGNQLLFKELLFKIIF
jgi:DNA polymerase-3 subunit delta